MAPGSALLKLLDYGYKLELTGVNTIKVPQLASQPPYPPFVAEGLPAPVVKLLFNQTTLGPSRKILIISAVTEELEAATPETATAVIGRVLADRSNAAIDYIGFDTNADNGTRPAGLLHGATPVTASTMTDPYSALADDLGNLAGAIGAAGIDPSDVVYVAGPREATIIKMRGGYALNVLMTLGLPAKSVVAVAPVALFSGFQDAPTIETSKEVELHFDDSVPKEIVDAAGTVAAPTSSTFQSGRIAIRVRGRCAWAVAPGGAQIVNGISW
jgi:hypothetical protein